MKNFKLRLSSKVRDDGKSQIIVRADITRTLRPKLKTGVFIHPELFDAKNGKILVLKKGKLNASLADMTITKSQIMLMRYLECLLHCADSMITCLAIETVLFDDERKGDTSLNAVLNSRRTKYCGYTLRKTHYRHRHASGTTQRELILDVTQFCLTLWACATEIPLVFTFGHFVGDVIGICYLFAHQLE